MSSRYVKVNYRNPWEGLTLTELVRLCNSNGFQSSDLPKPKNTSWNDALRIADNESQDKTSDKDSQRT